MVLDLVDFAEHLGGVEAVAVVAILAAAGCRRVGLAVVDGLVEVFLVDVVEDKRTLLAHANLLVEAELVSGGNVIVFVHSQALRGLL